MPPSSVRLELSLPRAPQAAHEARNALELRFASVVDDKRLAQAKLVATELVTNAVIHGEGQITLRAAVDGRHLRLEVIDEGEGQAPKIRELGEQGAGGWGLRLVDAVSARWGAHEGTTHVWADIPVS